MHRWIDTSYSFKDTLYVFKPNVFTDDLSDGVSLGDTAQGVFHPIVSLSDGAVFGDSPGDFKLQTILSLSDGAVFSDDTVWNVHYVIEFEDGVVLSEDLKHYTICLLEDGVVLGDLVFRKLERLEVTIDAAVNGIQVEFKAKAIPFTEFTSTPVSFSEISEKIEHQFSVKPIQVIFDANPIEY